MKLKLGVIPVSAPSGCNGSLRTPNGVKKLISGSHMQWFPLLWLFALPLSRIYTRSIVVRKQ